MEIQSLDGVDRQSSRVWSRRAALSSFDSTGSQTLQTDPKRTASRDTHSSSEYASLAAAVAERDRTIISLHADLERQAEMMKRHDSNATTTSQSSALLMFTKQYEDERNNAITLREQLTLANGEVRALRGETQRLLQENMVLAGKLSETRWEQAELLQATNELSEANRILKVKIQDRECQLRSKEAAIADERNGAAALAEQVRTLQKQFNRQTLTQNIISRRTKDSTTRGAIVRQSEQRAAVPSNGQMNLFSLVERRCLMGVELQRGDDGLGFSLATEQLPLSSDTCITVQSVRAGSLAEHHILEGDEIVEIEGQFCRNLPQSIVAARLRSTKALVQLVINRQFSKCPQFEARTQHSEVPMVPTTETQAPAVAAGESERIESTHALCEQTHRLLVDLQLQSQLDSLQAAMKDCRHEIEHKGEMVTVNQERAPGVAPTQQMSGEQRGVKGPDLLDITVDNRLTRNQTDESVSLADIRASLSAITNMVHEIRHGQLQQQQQQQVDDSTDSTIIAQEDEISRAQEDEISRAQSTSHVERVPDLFQTTSSPIYQEEDSDDGSSDDFLLSPLPPEVPPPLVPQGEKTVTSAIGQLLPAIEDLLEKKLREVDRSEDNESGLQIRNQLASQLHDERQKHAEEKVRYQEELTDLKTELRRRELEHEMDKERMARDAAERELKDRSLTEEMASLCQKSLENQQRAEDMEKQIVERNRLIDTMKQDADRKSGDLKHMLIEQSKTQRTVADVERQRKAEIEQSEQTKLQLEEEIKQARKEIFQIRKESDTVYLQRDKLREEHASAVSEKDALRRELVALQAEVETNRQLAEMSVKSHGEQEEELRQELHTLHTKLGQMEMEMQVRTRELEETRREREKQKTALQRKIEETETENRQIREERRKLEEMCALNVSTHDETLSQLNRVEAEAAAALRQVDVLTQSNQQSESQRSQVEQTLQHVQRQLDATQKELADSESQANSTETSLQETLRELNEKKVKLNETETRLLTVERTNAQIGTELNATKEAAGQLQTDIVRVQASYRALERLVEDSRKQLEEKETEIMDLRNERGKYEAELKETRGQLKEQMQKSAGCEARIQEIEGSLTAMTDREKRLEEQLSSALHRAREKDTETAAAIDALQTRNLFLQEELANKDASLMQTAHSHADTSGRMQQMSRELERLQDDLTQQRATTVKQQGDMVRQQSDYQQALHKHKKQEETIQAMEEEMIVLHQTNNILRQTVEKEEETNKKIKQEREELEISFKEMHKVLVAKAELLDKTESTVESLQSERSLLRQQVADQEGEVLAGQVKLAQTTRELDEGRTENERLTAQLRRLTTESSALTERNEQLKASCDKLSHTLERATQDKEKFEEMAKTMEFAFEEQRMKSERLAQDNSKLTVHLESEMDERKTAVSELEGVINGHTTGISALKHANALQQMQLEETTVAHDQLRAQMDSETTQSKVESEKLRDELHSQREATLMNRTTALELQNDLEKTRQDLVLTAESLQRKQEALKSETDTRQTLEGERSMLRQQLESEEDKTARLEEQNQEVQTALAKTHARMSELSQRLEQAQTASKTWKTKTEEQDMEVNRLNTERHQTIDEKSEMQRALHQAESKQRKLEEEARAQSDRADQLQATIERLSNETQQAIQSRDESEKSKSVMVDKIKTLTTRNQDAESTIKQLTACQSSLQESITKADEERDKEVSGLQSRIEILKTDTKNKKEALELLEASHAELRRRLDVAEEETKRAGELVGHVSELQAKLINAETTLEETNRELTEAKTSAAVVQGERDQLMVILREQGIQRHTEKPSTPAAMKRLRAGTASKEDVMVLLKDKDEEARRLKEYVDKLLAAVVDKAPFVLEAIK